MVSSGPQIYVPKVKIMAAGTYTGDWQDIYVGDLMPDDHQYLQVSIRWAMPGTSSYPNELQFGIRPKGSSDETLNLQADFQRSSSFDACTEQLYFVKVHTTSKVFQFKTNCDCEIRLLASFRTDVDMFLYDVPQQLSIVAGTVLDATALVPSSLITNNTLRGILLRYVAGDEPYSMPGELYSPFMPWPTGDPNGPSQVPTTSEINTTDFMVYSTTGKCGQTNPPTANGTGRVYLLGWLTTASSIKLNSTIGTYTYGDNVNFLALPTVTGNVAMLTTIKRSSGANNQAHPRPRFNSTYVGSFTGRLGNPVGCLIIPYNYNGQADIKLGYSFMYTLGYIEKPVMYAVSSGEFGITRKKNMEFLNTPLSVLPYALFDFPNVFWASINGDFTVSPYTLYPGVLGSTIELDFTALVLKYDYSSNVVVADTSTAEYGVKKKYEVTFSNRSSSMSLTAVIKKLVCEMDAMLTQPQLSGDRVGAVKYIRPPEFVLGTDIIGAIQVKNELPTGFTTITGKFLELTGLPASGSVKISHPNVALDTTSGIFGTSSKSYILDVNGEFSASVRTGLIVTITAPFIVANTYIKDASNGKLKVGKTNSIIVSTRDKTVINLKDIV
jgi:hypothetical protein